MYTFFLLSWYQYKQITLYDIIQTIQATPFSSYKINNIFTMCQMSQRQRSSLWWLNREYDTLARLHVRWIRDRYAHSHECPRQQH